MSMQTINFKKFKLASGDRILDLGCGEGRHVITAYMLENIESIGVDLSHKDLSTTLERFEEFKENDNTDKELMVSQANGLSLPFADHSFDKVICSEVLEHIPDYLGVLKEIRRVLKPGGIFAASVPRFGPERICWALSDAYHAMEGGHIRIFKAKQLRQEIEAENMVCYGKHWAHALHSPYWWLKCIFWDPADSAKLVNLYHRFLVWDLMKAPWFSRTLEKLLNPIMGKSVVMYFVKGLER